MKNSAAFRAEIRNVLKEIGEETLSYDKDEFWMAAPVYDYLEFYAWQNELRNTAIALPLARGLHNGSHRKSAIIRNGTAYKPPYVIHPLQVCRMLADLKINITHDEEDTLLAAALCHDMIEDLNFPNHGRELYEKYHLDKSVYDTVLRVSKRYDWTAEEEKNFFHNIAAHWPALLVKLSDRGNNVEDLYNMKVWKVHEYIGETRKFFLPMCQYGLEHYENLKLPLQVLRDKITTLTEAAELFVDDLEKQEQEMQAEVETLRAENAELRKEWMALWKEDEEDAQ